MKCPGCLVDFKPVSRRQRFCSAQCRWINANKNRAAKVQVVMRGHCPYCHKALNGATVGNDEPPPKTERITKDTPWKPGDPPFFIHKKGYTKPWRCLRPGEPMEYGSPGLPSKEWRAAQLNPDVECLVCGSGWECSRCSEQFDSISAWQAHLQDLPNYKSKCHSPLDFTDKAKLFWREDRSQWYLGVLGPDAPQNRTLAAQSRLVGREHSDRRPRRIVVDFRLAGMAGSVPH